MIVLYLKYDSSNYMTHQNFNLFARAVFLMECLQCETWNISIQLGKAEI